MNSTEDDDDIEGNDDTDDVIDNADECCRDDFDDIDAKCCVDICKSEFPLLYQKST